MPKNNRIQGENKVAEKSIYLDLATHKLLKKKAKHLGMRMSHLAIQYIQNGLSGKQKKRHLSAGKTEQVLDVKMQKIIRDMAIIMKCSHADPLTTLEAAKVWLLAFEDELNV